MNTLHPIQMFLNWRDDDKETVAKYSVIYDKIIAAGITRAELEQLLDMAAEGARKDAWDNCGDSYD